MIRLLVLLRLLLLLSKKLFDDALQDLSQKRNVGKTERLLVVPNAPRVQVGVFGDRFCGS